MKKYSKGFVFKDSYMDELGGLSIYEIGYLVLTLAMCHKTGEIPDDGSEGAAYFKAFAETVEWID